MAIVGAGPVGLALAIELSRIGLTTFVVDKRPPPSTDARLRPQLLVARAGDLAHLDRLGVDVLDPSLVSVLETRCEGDLVSGRTVQGRVPELSDVPPVPRDLWELSSQRPLALVPIGRLQERLLAIAERLGITVAYGCDVVRLRRHAGAVSLACADGTTARAKLAIIATGAARSVVRTFEPALGRTGAPDRKLIAGIFDASGERAHWARVELPVPGFVRPARCTLLQTPEVADAGTALLVDAQVPGEPTLEQLEVCFDTAARIHGLAGAPLRSPPQVFATGVTALARRIIAGDGRAPVVVAGDAAQTGHVFSGQTCFINLALALSLADRLGGAKRALRDGRVHAPEIIRALTKYDNESRLGAAILARASQRHVTRHAPGDWALAGVARA